MFGTLLESTRFRESKAGFTFMSVMAHAILVAGAAAATATAGRADDAPKRPEAIDVIYTIPDRRDAGARQAHRRTPQLDDAASRPGLPSIDRPPVTIPPLDIPAGLPPIDATGGLPTTGRPPFPDRGHGPVTGSYLGTGPSDGGVHTAGAVERTVVLRAAVEPAYPAALRHLGVEGAVRVRFVVDTLGRVELSSVDVRASDDAGFSAAVRAVLPRLRFAPARVGGRPVRQLVEMPFVFALRR